MPSTPRPDVPLARHEAAVTPRVRRRRWLIGILSGVTVIVLAIVGIVVGEIWSLNAGIHRSGIAPASAGPGVPQNADATNILIMGLDSRLDENGDPLPADVYDALHAGDQSSGGYNANVLMLIHIPAGGGRAVGMSIPRDDWVSLPGAPDGVSTAKIKEAYGYELDQQLRHLKTSQPSLSATDAYQQARADARQEEIDTVSQFLGGVPINHFIEVTMAAFYELAVAVQPIEVCLNAPTHDPYSGADFVAGHQELSATQAVAFVRQRRGAAGSVMLTDLDRDRRQQAFIVSLAYKLKQQNVFTDFPLMNSLIQTASKDIALDSGFDLLSFASDTNRFAGGGITFTTLPIQGFGVKDGKDVNLVSLPQVRAEAARLIAESDASSTPAPSAASTSPGTSPAPTPSATPSTPSNIYRDSQQPMTSGAIPCVN